MKIEKVELMKTLKCGDNVYAPGVYPNPVPRDLIVEALSGSGVVKITHSTPEPPPIIKINAPRDAGTSTTEVGTVSGVDVVRLASTTTTSPPKPSVKPKLKPRTRKVIAKRSKPKAKAAPKGKKK